MKEAKHNAVINKLIYYADDVLSGAYYVQATVFSRAKETSVSVKCTYLKADGGWAEDIRKAARFDTSNEAMHFAKVHKVLLRHIEPTEGEF